MTPEKLKKFEENVISLFKKGKINCPIHLSGGNEAELISLFQWIKPQDYVISTHRNHYHYLLKGGNPLKLLNEIIGLKTGICKGNGRSMHIFDKSINFLTSGIVAGGCAIAVGIALGIKMRNEKKHVWCFVGDGAEDSGFFFEAARFGLSRKLPLIFIIEDNNRAVYSTKKDRWQEWGKINLNNIIRYQYVSVYPHVGIGKHVSM